MSGPGCKCHACKALYRVDLLVPDEIWDRVVYMHSMTNTTGSLSNLMLCGNCIMTYLEVFATRFNKFGYLRATEGGVN